MGIEAGTAALIGTLLSAAGTGASMYNQRRTAQRAEDQALAGMATQRAKQREIDARLNQEVGALEQSGPEDEQAAALDAYLSQLRANRDQAQGTPTPGVSRYGQDTSAAKAAIQNYGMKRAGTLSRLDAAREQRRNEGIALNRAESDVAGTTRAAAGQDFINRLRMSQIRPNEWVDAGGALLQGVGSGIAASGGTDGYDYYADQMGAVGRQPLVRPGASVWSGAAGSSATQRLPVPAQRVG